MTSSPPAGSASSAFSSRLSTARRSMSRSAVAVSCARTIDRGADVLRLKLRLKRCDDVVQQRATCKPLAAGIALAGKVQQVADGRFQGREAGHDFVEHIEAAAIVVDSPPEQAEIQLHRHEAVADLVGDVRRHLPQVSEPIFAGQLAVLRFQLVGQTANLGLQRLVRMLQAVGRFVPGCQHRLQVELVARPARGRLEAGET